MKLNAFTIVKRFHFLPVRLIRNLHVKRSFVCAAFKETSIKEHKEHNLVGPRDPVSNIRKVIYSRSKNENTEEKLYREENEQIYEWHQEFWTKHNTNFTKSKKAFLASRLKDSDADEKQLADELSVFYKEFLDKNYMLHKNYQWEWYKKKLWYDSTWISNILDKVEEKKVNCRKIKHR